MQFIKAKFNEGTNFNTNLKNTKAMLNIFFTYKFRYLKNGNVKFTYSVLFDLGEGMKFLNTCERTEKQHSILNTKIKDDVLKHIGLKEDDFSTIQINSISI